MKLKDYQAALKRQIELWEAVYEEVVPLEDGGPACQLVTAALAELEKIVGPKAQRPAAARRSRYPNVYWNESKQAWVGRIHVGGELLTYGASKDEDRTWQSFLAGLQRAGHGAVAGKLVEKAGLVGREIGR